MKRVPFDQSGNDESICPCCGVKTGQYHLLGCIAEHCPQCEKLIGACTCYTVNTDDKAIAIKLAFDLLQTLENPWAFAASLPSQSIMGTAAWIRACLCTEVKLVRAMAAQGIGIVSNLDPRLPRYNVADVARALGYPSDEVDALALAFFGHDGVAQGAGCWLQ